MREAGQGEIAGTDKGDGADDGHARVRDVCLGVEFSFCVGAAFDLASAEGSNDGGNSGEEIIFLLFGFDAVVEPRRDVLLETV